MKIKGKQFLKKVHLWLGLSSGLLVFIIAITGAIYTFHHELQDWVYGDIFYMENVPADKTIQPFSQLQRTAETALNAKATFMEAYRADNQNWMFVAYKPHETNTGWTYFDKVDYYKIAFVNPYSGALVGLLDFEYEFFEIIKMIHWSLLLKTEIGQPIVGVATIVFVMMLISGLILWWPKRWNKKQREQRLKIKLNGSFKRTNYDLHNVLGFYALLVALILGLTGMVWAFDWFKNAVYFTASGGAKKEVAQPFISEFRQGKSGNRELPVDVAFLEAQRRYPQAERLGVQSASTQEGSMQVYAYRGHETYYDHDVLHFDQYTGKYLGSKNFADKNAGEKIIGMNYDIHVGAILGFPGKVLVFLASLIVASLPITGFLIWYGRKYKKKHKRKVAPPVRKKLIKQTVPRRMLEEELV